MTASPPVGALFVVNQVVDYEEDGKVIARYLPELGPYRVTLRNADFVGNLAANHRATVVGMTSRRAPAGIVTVKEG